MCYKTATREVLSFLPSWDVRCQRSGSDASVPIPDRDFVLVLMLSHKSMRSCTVAWRVSNGRIRDVPEEIGVASVDVPEINDLTLFFGKDSGWSQYVSSIDPCLFKTWVIYQSVLVSSMFSVPRTPIELIENGPEVLPSITELWTSIWKAKTREHDAQAAREVADAKLENENRNSDETVVFRELPAASNMSEQGLIPYLPRLKEQLVQLTAEEVQLSTKVGAVGTERYKSFKLLADVCGARDLAERLGRFVAIQPVENLVAFVYPFGTLLEDYFRTWLENAYTAS